MSIKLKILKESQDNTLEGFIMQEGFTTLAAVAAALGVSVLFLKSLFSPSEARKMDGMTAAQLSDYIDETVHGGKEEAERWRAQKKAEDARMKKEREEELKRMKAERAAAQSQQAPDLDLQGIPMRDYPEVSIPEEDLKRYVDIMNRVSRGEGRMSNPRLQKLIAQYGEENLKSAAAGMLYEIFKRFL